MTAPPSSAAGSKRGRTRRREPSTPIVPPQTIAGRALALVIAIMTFLAGLTVGAVTVVDSAATAWESDIGREVTIEVRPMEGSDIVAELQKAVALAQEFPGVGGARALSDEETRRLLEPWLGAGVELASLPVPRLVVVTVDDAAAFQVSALAEAVRRDVRGGNVDDHAAWIDRLRAMAQSMVAVGVGIFALMLAALVLSVVFATRAAMAGNRSVIEVLHFCGAEDGFIARQFQRHFLLLGVKGGAAGGGLAALAFLGFAWYFATSSGVPGADQINTLVGGFVVGPEGYLAVLGLVVAVALLTAATSRLAVRRYLAEID